MSVYFDASAVMRVVLGQPGRLPDVRLFEGGFTSVLSAVECARSLDRARLRQSLSDEVVAEASMVSRQLFRAMRLVELDAGTVTRAAGAFPTVVRALDALHLATALALRDRDAGLVFATHDAEQRTAAQALGFQVIG